MLDIDKNIIFFFTSIRLSYSKLAIEGLEVGRQHQTPVENRTCKTVDINFSAHMSN